MPKEVAYNKKKKQTNALSSLRQLCALISLLKSKQAAWNQNCWEVFKSHPGWLLSRPQGFCLPGPFGSSFPEHISGQRPAAGHQDPHRHTAHSTDLLCLQELPCPRLCSFDRRPAGQKNKQELVSCHGHMHASFLFFPHPFGAANPSRPCSGVDASVSAAVCGVVFQPFSELGPIYYGLV